jgi:hypothetical protein
VNARPLQDRVERASPRAPAAPARRAELLSDKLSRRTRATAVATIVAGLGCWALGGGIVALWCFVVAAVAVALALPLRDALVSPLFMGLLGWLVDMLPLVVLAGWAAVVARWVFELARERRRPRGGRWIWLPIALSAWTALGVTGLASGSFKRFVLLVGVQVLASGTLLAVVDRLGEEDRRRCAASLLAFVVALSAGVVLEWFGVPLQQLQDGSVSDRVEAAYGVDAFPNSLPMVKYVRSSKAGAPALRAKLAQLGADNPQLPAFEVFKPKFQAWRTSLLVRFAGSARPVEEELARLDIELLYDNVGLAPANTVPRMRSFPRNSLTYAGLSAALFPVAFYFAWTGTGVRRRLGQAGIAACLFGAAFSLARGAWIAVILGASYLAVDGVISRRRKLQVGAAVIVAGLALTGLFMAKYGVDPLRARGEAEGSVNTRSRLYGDTIGEIRKGGLHVLVGYGTEATRGAGGSSHVLGRYVPSSGTHSTYLNYLFRTGIVGALLLIAIYALAFLHARAASRRKRGDATTFATALSASVLLVAAHGMILSLYVEPFYTLGVSLLFGLAIAVGADMGRPLLPWRARGS